MHARALFGRSGEELAAQMYERMGFTVLDRNFRTKEGEIDLIVRHGRLLVFCEVKTRRSRRWGEPAEAVAYAKQARLRSTAAQWMRARSPGRVELRFDVVSIVIDSGRPYLTHIPGAF